MVLVVHDVSNEYSHETIDSEVLKCLFSHPEKESILVLNKTDNLKNKKKLLDLVTSLTGGQLNGKEFMPKEKKLKFNRNTLSDSDYEALFAKTAQKMNLKLANNTQI
jgi:GTPase Era involved in 16S rRNA processing